MSQTSFIKSEFAAAVARGVRQCVVIASGTQVRDALSAAPSPTMRVFVVDESAVCEPSTTFVPTQFDSETLAAALEKSEFDKLKASLFVWLGGAGYQALDSVMGTLGFIASLPKGTGVVFDYVAERSGLGQITGTALDALASRISLSSGAVKYLIQPQAVTALLGSLGFREIADLTCDGHLVSAVV